jgi:DNA-binding GntR family transcriptional regulator
MRHAYDSIRTRIADGTYPAGTRLVLDQMSREFGISQLPVREALRLLEAEGYISYARNVGAQVNDFDHGRYAEAMETLAVMESAVTALAVPRLRRADLQAARRLNREMRRSLEAADPVRFAQLGQEFHRTLYSRCPNAYLVGLVEREWARMGTVRRATSTFVPELARASLDEHEELLALVERDASAAEVENIARVHRLRTVDALADS